MKWNKLFTTVLLGIICVAGMAQEDATLFDTPFTSYEKKDMPYRIPAIVQTSDNDILVIVDKRHDGGDVGQNGSSESRIDLVYRRWNGTEWEEEKNIATGKNTFGYGDAAVVADRENPSNILLMCAAGNVFFTDSKSSSRLQCCRIRSTDGGITWSTPDNVTDAIYKEVDYNGAFFSSGRICQSSQIKVGTHYRLYAALCVTGTNSVVVYSDDFGDTWTMLGSVAVSGGNEAKCEELPDGDVVVSSRTAGGRIFNVYHYNSMPIAKNEANGDWKEEGSGISNADSGTNGEILIVPAYNTSAKQLCNLILQSFPAKSEGDAKRSHVTIYHKELDTKTTYETTDITTNWNSYSLEMTTKGSAYSSMIWQADGNVGFVWEDDYWSRSEGALIWKKTYGGYDIKYKNLTLTEITDGVYSNVRPWAMSQVSCSREWCAEASFSTLYLPYGVMLPKGVTAYTGSIEGDVLTIKAIEDGIVPESTAVLLEDEQARATIDLTMVNTTNKITDNDLEGTLDEMPISSNADYYVLGHGANHIGFYHPSKNVLKANAAYIPSSKVPSGKALRIRREGDATDIEEAELINHNPETIYDLMGRRVTEMQPGRMYIVNGKKVVY